MNSNYKLIELEKGDKLDDLSLDMIIGGKSEDVTNPGECTQCNTCGSSNNSNNGGKGNAVPVGY